MNKILDYIFFTRPILFFPGWTTILMAIHFAKIENGMPIRVNWFPDFAFVTFFVAIAMLMASASVLNQICDIESDKQNNKLPFLANHIVSLRGAYIFAVSLAIAAFFLLLQPQESIYYNIAVVISFLTGGYLYNYQPFAFKNKVFAGLLANMVMGASVFAIGFFTVGDSFIAMLLWGLPVFLINTGLYVVTTLPDIEGDRADNKMTIGVYLGTEKSLKLATLLFIPGSLVFVFFDVWTAVALLPGGIYFALAGYGNNLPTALTAIKYAMTGMALRVVLLWPWYLGVIVLAYLITRVYYHRRFGLNYPSFSDD
jgi:4-hydroxybenzoate polyprenyltransferase